MTMKVKSINQQTSNGIFKIVPEEGPVFYIRKEYLTSVAFEDICAGAEFSDEQTGELLDAGLACAVEIKAMDYLARAEQCRFNLYQKLIKKDFNKKYVNMCLDYLESVNYLNDKRFSDTWLHARRLNHYEGRTKLLAELQGRGINKTVAQQAVNDFFETNDENEIALKALNKYIKQGKSEEKLTAAMINAGFSYLQIKMAKEREEEI